MYPKQGTKEPGKGESGYVKRSAWDALRDQSGSAAVLLPECLHVNSRSLTNNSNRNSLTRTLKGRGTKRVSVTQNSSVQEYRS